MGSELKMQNNPLPFSNRKPSAVFSYSPQISSPTLTKIITHIFKAVNLYFFALPLNNAPCSPFFLWTVFPLYTLLTEPPLTTPLLLPHISLPGLSSPFLRFSLFPTFHIFRNVASSPPNICKCLLIQRISPLHFSPPAL